MRRQKIIAAAAALLVIGGGGIIAFMRIRACTSAGEARPLDETVRTDELVVRYSTDFAATRLGPNTVGLSRTVLRPLGFAGVEMLMFDQTPLRDDGKDLHAISDEMIEPLFAADRAQGDRIDHIEGRAATCNGRRAWETTAVEEGPRRERTSHRVCVFVRGESVFIVAYHVPTDLAERDEHVLHRIAEAFEPTEKASPSENDRVVAGLRPRFRACYNDGLRLDPTIQGATTIVVSLAPDGHVRSAAPADTAGLPDQVVECIASALRNAAFSAQPATGTSLHVPVRFKLDAR